MNEDTRSAAAEYAKCQKSKSIIQEARDIKAFMAGAGWALRSLNFISVQDELPPNTKRVFGHTGKCLCIVQYTNGGEIEVDDYEDSHEEESELCDKSVERFYLKRGWYELQDQAAGMYDECFVKRDIKYWCPIPEQLLKF